MATAPRQLSLRTGALVIGGLTFSIVLAVAVFGWIAGWRTVDPYSNALYIAGLGAAFVGVAGMIGNQTGGTQGQFGAASLEIAHQQTRGQSDYFQGAHKSFVFLGMMAIVALLVAGAGLGLQLLFG